MEFKINFFWYFKTVILITSPLYSLHDTDSKINTSWLNSWTKFCFVLIKKVSKQTLRLIVNYSEGARMSEFIFGRIKISVGIGSLSNQRHKVQINVTHGAHIVAHLEQKLCPRHEVLVKVIVFNEIRFQLQDIVQHYF